MAMTTTAAPSPAIPPEILSADLARRLFEGTRTSRHMTYAVWLAMAAIFHASLFALLTLAVGFVVHYAISVVFKSVRVRYMDDPAARSPEDWKRAHTLLSLAGGGCWGVTAAILMSTAGDPARAMLYVVVLGLATGSATVRSAHRPSLLAYVVPMVGLPSAALVAHGDIAALTVGGGGMVYMLFLVMVARDHHRLLVEHATLTYSNGDLARRLGASLDETVAALRDAEQARNRLQDAIHATPSGFALHDSEDRLVVANDAYARFFDPESSAVLKVGETYEQAVRRRLASGFVRPENRARGEAWVAEMQAHHRTFGDRERATADDRWTRVSKHLTREGGVVTLVTDLSEARAREAELATAKEEAERARAETAQALERLQVVIDNMSDGVMLFDSELRWAIDNAKVRDLLALPAEVAHAGARSEDIQRFQIARGDFGAIEDVDADIRDWLARRKAAGVMSYTRWTPAGRFIEYRSKPLGNGEIVATYRDITDLKRHEEELATAKELAESTRATMRTVLENLTDGVVMYDADGRFIYRNEAMGYLYGIDEKTLQTLSGAADVWRFMARRGDFGSIDDIEAWVAERVTRLRAADGSAGQVISATGRIIEMNYRGLPAGGLLAVHRDITELKRNEAELASARSTMRTVLENFTDGVILHGADGKFLYLNAAMSRLYGIPAETLDAMSSAEEAWRYMAARGDYGPLDDIDAWVGERVARLHAADGRPVQVVSVTGRTVEMSYRTLPDGGVLAVHRDITELKRVQAEAEQARNRLEDAIRALPSGFALHDSETRLVANNDAYELYFGEQPGALRRGATYGEQMHLLRERGRLGPTLLARGDAWIADMVEYHRTSFGDREMATADNRWVRISKHQTRDGGVVTLITDLSEAKARERELARAQADAEAALSTARDIIETMPIGATLVGPDLRIRQSNGRVSELFELTPEMAVPGQPFVEPLRQIWARGDFGDVDFDQRVEGFFSRMRSEGGLRYERQLPNGRHVDFHFTMLPDGGFLGAYVDITEAKRHEEALALARSQAETALSTARTIIETMPIGAALVGPDNRVRLANRRLPALLGFPDELAAEGRPYIDAIRYLWERGDFTEEVAFDDRAAAFFARIRDQREVRYERKLPGGRDIAFHFTALPDGGFLGAYVDITEAKRREAELATARALLQDAIDSTPDGFALWDEEDRLIVCNEGYRRYYTGIPLTIEPGRHFADILGAGFDAGLFIDAPPTRAAFIEATLRTRTNPGLAPREHRLRGDLSLQVIDRRTASGGLVSVYADISEQKRRQREVEQARDAAEAAGRDAANARVRLVDAIEAMPNGFVLADADERIVIANQRFLEYYAPIADIIVPGADMRWTLAEAARRGAVPTGGKSIEDWVETRMAMRANPGPPRVTHQPDGRWLVIAERRTREGGYASMYTDISELKRREAELELARDEAEAANQAKSTFLATMSHEIRTPMNGVLGMMEILERQGIDEEQQTTVETMRESAQALLRIIDDVLDFSKIEAGRLELESTSFSLSGVIDGAIAAMRPQATEKNLPLSADTDPGSSDALEGDPVRVRQILINLLGNAVKFTERGFVRVAASTTPLGDGRIRVSLSVADSGIGMDAPQLARLFEPFAQADSSTTRRYGGTGLGLSIVRRLAQLMEGDATVESKPGVGTTFRVTLVLRAAPADSPLRAITPITARARRRLPLEGAARVLVVDDHPVNLKVLVKQLEMLGVATETAVDGVEALAMWRMGSYAAVLADIHMPRMDGYELAGRIRHEESEAPEGTRRTPMIAVTANAMRGEEERCLAAGMDAYLAKPVTFDRLRAALSRWLPLEQDDGDATIAETPAIDESTLRAWLGDDPDAVAELLQDFLRDARQAERDIGASLTAGNLPALAATAHRLKGSGLAIGARRLAEVAAALEQAGRIGDRAACQDGLGTLAGELRRVAAKIGK